MIPSNDEQLGEHGVAVPAATDALPVAPAPAKPDITKAQIVGAVPVVANLLAAFHVYTVTGAQEHALELALGGGVALFVADAIIRFGRSIGLR